MSWTLFHTHFQKSEIRVRYFRTFLCSEPGEPTPNGAVLSHILIHRQLTDTNNEALFQGALLMLLLPTAKRRPPVKAAQARQWTLNYNLFFGRNKARKIIYRFQRSILTVGQMQIYWSSNVLVGSLNSLWLWLSCNKLLNWIFLRWTGNKNKILVYKFEFVVDLKSFKVVLQFPIYFVQRSVAASPVL